MNDQNLSLDCAKRADSKTGGMAPQTSEAKKAAMSGGEDLISALPDGVAGHIVGFLPAEQAVQTSVLAQQWRHVWCSSMRRLRFVSSDGRLESSYNFNKLVYRVLLRRDPSMALDEVEFTGTSTRFWHENNIDLNAWIRHALLCRVSLLCVRLPFNWRPMLDGSVALASRYLKGLEIAHVVVDGYSVHLRTQGLFKRISGDVAAGTPHLITWFSSLMEIVSLVRFCYVLTLPFGEKERKREEQLAAETVE
ncbi:hypothetical protein EJB05_36916, partial [Eragrostis curvula]